MKVKLTKSQEAALVELGIKTLLERVNEKPTTKRGPYKKKAAPKTKVRRWTKQQHEKYAATMERKWGKIRSKKSGQ